MWSGRHKGQGTDAVGNTEEKVHNCMRANFFSFSIHEMNFSDIRRHLNTLAV